MKINIFLAAFLLCTSVEMALAQGTISGTVKDSTGAVVPEAMVVVLNEGTGISRTASTDEAGRYSAPALSLGNYRVTGSREGLQTVVRSGIVLTVGREAIVDLTLSVGAVTQQVEVTGEAPLVESTTASIGALVNDRTIRALPLNGRSYDQLALLQPGVILTDPGPVGTPYQYGTGKRFTVGGQRSYSNSFLLDGTNISDEGNGTPGGAAGTNLGVDTIREFMIFTNSYKAEFGRTNGSVTLAITRSGTNAIHGTAFEYIRNSALDARNFFDVSSGPPPFKRNQFGGVLGGPIKKDKTFFFAGYEGLRQGRGTTQIATVPTLLARQGILPAGQVPVNPTIVPFLNVYPAPNGRDFGDGTGEFLSAPTIVTNEDNVMARVDHQLNAKTSIFGRYTFDEDNLNFPQSIPPFVQLSASRRQYSTLQAMTIFSPKALNTFRFAFNRTYNNADSISVPAGPLSIIPGQPLGVIAVGGVNTGGTRALTQLGARPGTGAGPTIWAFNVFEWADDFTYVTGQHSFKFGVDIQRVQNNQTKTASLWGAYTFPTFTALLAGSPSSLMATSPLGVTNQWGVRQSLFALYAQDDYKVNSRLNLNLGLRWETTTDPYNVNGMMSIIPSPEATAPVMSDRYFRIVKKNFEPRLGLAWQLNSSGKTVLRAGAGIYHNQILPWLYGNQLKSVPFFGNLSATNPPFPDGYKLFTGLSATGLIQLQSMAPVNKTPANYQYNLSIQHAISKDTLVQITYAGNKANHLATLREVDPATSIILPNGQRFYPAGAPRVNPTWNGYRLIETVGNSHYNSITATLRRQSASGFVGQIFYTFSKAMDQSSNADSTESARSPNGQMDPYDRARDWGLADFNSSHAAIATFSYPFPIRSRSKALGAIVNDWALNGIGTFTSGLPFTARLATSVSRDRASVLTERPDLKAGASQNPNNGTSVGCAGFAAGKQLGGADNFYDPCSFTLPAAGTYGNLGRNTIIGPGVATLDFSLEKNFKVQEKANVTFRAEVFNILNHTNLGLPGTAPLTAAGVASPSAGRVTYTTSSSRQIQFVLRINF